MSASGIHLFSGGDFWQMHFNWVFKESFIIKWSPRYVTKSEILLDRGRASVIPNAKSIKSVSLTNNFDFGTSHLNLIHIWTTTLGIPIILYALAYFNHLNHEPAFLAVGCYLIESVIPVKYLLRAYHGSFLGTMVISANKKSRSSLMESTFQKI